MGRILMYDITEIMLEVAYMFPNTIEWLANLYCKLPIIEIWKVIVIITIIDFVAGMLYLPVIIKRLKSIEL